MENTIDLMQQSAGYGSKPTAANPTTVRMIAVILITLAGYFATRFLGKSIAGLLGAADSDYKKQFIGVIPSFIFFLVMIACIMKKPKVLTSNGNGFWGGLITGGFLIFGALDSLLAILFITEDANGAEQFAIPSGLTFGAEQVWVILALLLSAGICEELMFRGIILNALRDRFGKDTFKGTAWAIVISGIMFGCMHFINLTAGVPLKSVLIQVITVCGAGILFGAIYCRWGNIKVTIFLHFIQDICIILPMSMQSGAGLAESIGDSASSWGQLGGLVIYCAIAAFLLRKKVRHQLFSYDLDETTKAA